MGTKRTGGSAGRLAEARRSFEHWRRSRRTRRDRIPERLWRMAVEAAVTGGVGATARQLRLNPRKLKERMPAAEPAARQEQPQFVEWPWVEGTALPECVLEAEGPAGPSCASISRRRPRAGRGARPHALEGRGMIQTSPSMRILVAVEPVDFRRGIDGLAAICRQQLERDPMNGWAFVFRNRRADGGEDPAL